MRFKRNYEKLGSLRKYAVKNTTTLQNVLQYFAFMKEEINYSLSLLELF
jgi:hypothetical protein